MLTASVSLSFKKILFKCIWLSIIGIFHFVYVWKSAFAYFIFDIYYDKVKLIHKKHNKVLNLSIITLVIFRYEITYLLQSFFNSLY